MTKNQSRLIIVCGLPGAGKTTHAKLLEASLQGIRFCPDEWMDKLRIDLYDESQRALIEDLQWQFAQQLLKLGLTAIIEWGTWARGERDTLRIRAKELGATVELHYLTAPISVLFERTRLRGAQNPPITLDAMTKWASLFQAPTDEELALFDKTIRPTESF